MTQRDPQDGQRGPVGFNYYAEFIKNREAIQSARRERFGPTVRRSQAELAQASATDCIVRITGPFNTNAKGWPAVLTWRNLESDSTNKWIEGESVMVFEVNENDLEVNKRYRGQVYELKQWGDNLSMFVAVQSPLAPEKCSLFECATATVTTATGACACWRVGQKIRLYKEADKMVGSKSFLGCSICPSGTNPPSIFTANFSLFGSPCLFLNGEWTFTEDGVTKWTGVPTGDVPIPGVYATLSLVYVSGNLIYKLKFYGSVGDALIDGLEYRSATVTDCCPESLELTLFSTTDSDCADAAPTVTLHKSGSCNHSLPNRQFHLEIEEDTENPGTLIPKLYLVDADTGLTSGTAITMDVESCDGEDIYLTTSNGTVCSGSGSAPHLLRIKVKKFDCTRSTYLCRLVSKGPGVDGGYAWKAWIRKEVDGSIVDHAMLGAPKDSPSDGTYCLYVDLGPEAPEPKANDIVYATLDPLKDDVYLFTEYGGSSNCHGCGWLARVGHKSCIWVRSLGGGGTCGCVPVDSDGVVAPYVPGLGGWLATRMGKTCCGCGGLLFKSNALTADYDLSPEGPPGYIRLENFHVACAGGGGSGSGGGSNLYSQNLRIDCCGIDPRTGNPFAIFYGFGPNPCDESEGDTDPEACLNVFRIKVSCEDCPSPNCDCPYCGDCCKGASPFGWYANISSFPDNHLNGLWVYSHASKCKFTAVCDKGGSYTSEIDVVKYDGGDGIENRYRLNHAGNYYLASSLGLGKCCDQIEFSKEDPEADGPDTITLIPILIDDECPECEYDWPDEVCVELMEIHYNGGAYEGYVVGDYWTLPRTSLSPLLYSIGDPDVITPGGEPSGGGEPFPAGSFACVSGEVGSCNGFTVGIQKNENVLSMFGGRDSLGPPAFPSELIDCGCRPLMMVGSGYTECLISTGCGPNPAGSSITYVLRVTEGACESKPLPPDSMPETVMCSIVGSAECPSFTGTVTLTKVGPKMWSYSNPGAASGIISVDLRWSQGAWSAIAELKCLTTGASFFVGAYGTSSLPPDYDPFEIGWTGLIVAGTIDVAGCCVATGATVNMSFTE